MATAAYADCTASGDSVKTPPDTASPRQAQALLAADQAPLAAGQTYSVGQLRIHRLPIFDLADPAQNNWLFRAANRAAERFGLRTREWVIADELLFAEGTPVNAQILRESERLLRARPYLYDARVLPSPPCDGRVDVDVVTRDVWTLNPRVDLERSGGANSFALGFSDVNLFGTGKSLTAGYASDVDRSGVDVAWFDPNVRGSHATLAITLADNDDGHERALALAQPFYALTTRRAFGVAFADSAREDALYLRGNEVARFLHDARGGNVFAGWSRGLERDVQRRLRFGFSWQHDRYAPVAGSPAPPSLPRDRTVASPFVAYEQVEDEYATLTNYNRVGRREDIYLGKQIGLLLGWSGAGDDRIVFDVSQRDGHRIGNQSLLRYRVAVRGYWNLARDAADDAIADATLEFQSRHAESWRFYASGTASRAWNLAHTQLLLGGDNGLRGYPLRYQDGDRQLLLSLEERYFSDIHLWQVVRVAAAVFADVGRAWRPGAGTRAGGDWLADAGFGLRFESTRTLSGRVLHVDVAFPLVNGPDVAGTQLLVSIRNSL